MLVDRNGDFCVHFNIFAHENKNNNECDDR